ncbi:MAG: hypothetical protein ABJE95_05085 [Byssovorax sp.]
MLAALALVSGLPLLLSCSPAPLGEIVIAIRTDIAIPKDIDRIIIDVTIAKTGESKFTMAYQALDPAHTFKLPATLAFTASATDPGAAVRVRVLALRGDGAPRMVREVVTTVPADRTVTLPIPIEFLCDGTTEMVLDPLTKEPVRDKKGDLVFKSTCDDGMTCSAGKCVDVTVPEVSLASYSGALIFGGGTGSQDGDCFDAASCFEGSTFADVNLGNCTIQAGNDVNVALLTQGAGSCGASGCFVPLDAESDAGWQPDQNGALRLPPAVCDKIKSRELGGVVTAPAGKSPCARKASSLPICGPFSSSGKYVAPSATAPIVVASGQQNPVALGLEETPAASRVYWTVRGTFDPNGNPSSDGAVKRAQTTGEEAVVIAKDQPSPHDIVVSGSQGVAFWTNASGSAIGATALGSPMAMALISNLGRPEGIALDGTTVVWTDLTSNQVSSTQFTLGKGGTISSGPSVVVPGPSPMGSAPRRIAAANGLVCWTYEDKLDSTNGVVACNDGTGAIPAASTVATPRSIALVPTGVGAGATVYFASFADRNHRGGVYSVASTGGGTPTLVNADGEDYPNGLAVDNGVVYWTSRTRGAVMRLKGGTLTEIASHQINPGAIVVGKDAVFWVNEGTVDKADGAIVRSAK